MGLDHLFVAHVRAGSGAIGIGPYGADVQLDLVGAEDVEVRIASHAPGDVSGLDAGAVVRTVPHGGAVDFEPSQFAAVELIHPALPWMLSPPGSTMPWLVLIVVEDGPGITLGPGPGGIRVLTVAAPARVERELPDLAQIAGWTHAHGMGATGAAIPAATFARSSDPSCARLVCPRRLEPHTRYHAAVVPAFAAGVRAGLGEDPGTIDEAPAWTSATTGPLRLPVYVGWSFATGDEGDFASLARRLTPRRIEGASATRVVDASGPAWGIAAVAGRSVLIGGLVRPDTTVIIQAAPTVALGAEIGAAIDAAADADAADPVLSPPCYGAFATGIGAPARGPTWQAQVNRDVRLRVAAGLGAEVVRRRQDQLVDAAWRQLGDAEDANRLIRFTALGVALSTRLVARHLSGVSVGELLQITHPSHRRVRTAAVAGDPSRFTLGRKLADSALPTGAVSVAFRTLARPGARLARDIGAAAGAAVVARANFAPGTTGRIDVAPLRALPPSVATFDGLSTAIGVAIRFAAARPAAVDAAAVHWHAQPVTPVGPVRRPVIHRDHRDDPGLDPLLRRRDDTDPDGPIDDPIEDDVPDLPSHGIPPIVIDAFAAAARRHQHYLVDHLGSIPRRPLPLPLAGGDLGGLRGMLLAAAAPEATAIPRLASRIEGADIAASTLTRISITPVLERPLLADVAAIALDAVMPGLAGIATDTVAMLVPDDAAITAFLVGANHELASELMWRRYPGPPSATLLRHFWGRVVAGATGATRPPDVPPISEWSDTGPPDIPVQLILFVRGELLRRYPNAVFHLVGARWSGVHRVLDPDAERPPIVRVPLGDDTALFGFDLDPAVVVGAGSPAGSAGWYVVIDEHPHEPRFGLAAVPSAALATWTDLAWADVTADDLHGGTHLRTDGALAARHPANDAGLAWGRDGAQQAAITLRRPTRIAIHASRLIEI